MEESIIKLFEQVGLNATMLFVFGWYILKKDKEKAETDKDIRKRNDKERDILMNSIIEYRKVNEEFLKTNIELAQTNRIMVEEFSRRFDNIENNVLEIKSSVNELKQHTNE